MSVHVRYFGRLGNRLFQYSLGRIIAEELGYQLHADPIEGFSGTYKQVQGYDAEESAPVELLGKERINLEAILENTKPRKIILDGWFQRYEFYRPYKDKIRQEWLKVDQVASPKPHPDDLVLNIRRGDFLYYGQATPFSFYQKLIESQPYRRLVIVTDDIRDPFFWRFSPYGYELFKGSPMQHFWYLMHARRLIISKSTFSWWAAFLSSAESIVDPIPHTKAWSGLGFSDEEIDFNLTVDDEPRFNYIQCKEDYKMNMPERIHYERSNFYRRRVANIEPIKTLLKAKRSLQRIHHPG